MTLGSWTGGGRGLCPKAASDPGFVPCVGALGSPSLEAGFVDLAFSQFPGSQGAAVNQSKVFGHISGPARGPHP